MIVPQLESGVNLKCIRDALSAMLPVQFSSFYFQCVINTFASAPQAEEQQKNVFQIHICCRLVVILLFGMESYFQSSSPCCSSSYHFILSSKLFDLECVECTLWFVCMWRLSRRFVVNATLL